jgi:hypothetical protein
MCGDNNGQHSNSFDIQRRIWNKPTYYLFNLPVYLDVPSSATTPTDLQLMLNFGAGTGNTPRSWNIKIAMLPCGASYLGINKSHFFAVIKLTILIFGIFI